MSPRARPVASTTRSEESTLDEPLLSDEDQSMISSSTPPSPSQDDGQPYDAARISRNVPIALTYTAFVFAGRSVWSQSVLSTYVFLLRQDDYRAVGFITAAMGLAQLLTSFPSGILADRYRRDTLLRGASLVGLLAIGSTLWAIHENDYKALVVGLAVWGCYWGICNTALSAIFADSIPTGQRSLYFTRRSMLVNAGFAVGPTVSLILFARLGDEWKIRDCAIVLAVGQAICLPAIALLWCLSDDHVVPHEEAVVSHQSDQTANDRDNVEATNDRPTSTDQSFEPAATNSSSNFNNNEASLHDSAIWQFLVNRRIALLIATADLTSGLASGMSIRYFPIFFVENLSMSPVKVQVLYALTPFFLASCMRFAQSLSITWGRCRVSVAFKWTGVALMWALVAAARNHHMPRWMVCTIYIVRTASINSTGALTRSVLMDHVPPCERGRWAALESLNMFSWSGSAALGGYLVGRVGMLPLFCTTATIQFFATIPLIILSTEEKLESHQSHSSTVGETSEVEEAAPSSDSNTLTQPLLTNESETTSQRRRGSV